MSWNWAMGPTLAKEETRPPTADEVANAVGESITTAAGAEVARSFPCMYAVKAASKEGDGK